MSVEQLGSEALKLTTEERARLAERILLSLDDDPEIKLAWEQEIIRRCSEIDNGTAELIPSSEVFAALRAKRP